MFVPIMDDAPVRSIRHAYVNDGFIIVSTLIYVVFQSGLVMDANQQAVLSFGLIPSVLFGDAVLPAGFEIAPAWTTLGSSLFLHGGWLHLIGNLLFLWVFGDNVEDDLGHVRYALFVMLCGVGGGIAHAVTAANVDAPLVGASGVVAGVVAAYVMLHPQVKVWVMVFYRLPLRLRAFWIIGAWAVFQAGNALLAGSEQVAWWAHVGGFLTGAVLVVALKRPDVPLFDRDLIARVEARSAPSEGPI
ncbi:rhomboid family intramembrane serine protease [Methylopila turkensis]|uniref:Rhomboid family intramembrane serine protease n=1 Tax=Methylopila turkensis TaxID=1437816 RepID=A0A9W6JN87_9HYPH|nr:rhomboid family intramembrane serine protease [Methylopila turkensis]GLK79259.1 rhomboid family intramembrane serine protease [Methylopila turkensis]